MRTSGAGPLVSSLFLCSLGCSAVAADVPGSGIAGAGAGGGAPLLAGGSGAGAGPSATTAGAGGSSGSGNDVAPGGPAGSLSAAGSGGAGGGGAGGVGGVGSAGGAGGVDGPDENGFVHPGILLNRSMLDFVKAKLAASEQPWKKALNAASGSRFGSLSYTAKPHDNVQCGPSSNPDIGCSDEKDDVIAAYTHALLWYYTGQKAHADKAIEIMNAWSAVLKKHTFDNEQLQAAWCAEVFPRAAEIIRYTNAGWSKDDIARFETMLKTAYLPEVKDGSTRTGNWDTSAIDAAMNIAVFLDDRAELDKTVALWKARTPAYIYLKSDGALPVQPPRETPRSSSSLKGYWFDPKQFVDGLSQESCRDRPGGGTQGFGHAQYGVAAIINAAETARIQGIDLFSLEKTRLLAFMELHSKYMNGASTDALCNTQIADVSPDPMWEIGYNAYAGVFATPMPQTLTLVQSMRPTGATHHMAWETLTHAGIGAVGLP